MADIEYKLERGVGGSWLSGHDKLGEAKREARKLASLYHDDIRVLRFNYHSRSQPKLIFVAWGKRNVNPASRPFTVRARDFDLGGLERHGEYTTITREGGAFVIRRHPEHPAGHAVESARTLTQARSIARRLAKGKAHANPASLLPLTWKKAQVRRLPNGQVQVKIAGTRSHNPTSKSGRRKWSVVRAAANRWALKRQVWNDHYHAWMEQADRLFSSKSAAQAAGRDWLSQW